LIGSFPGNGTLVTASIPALLAFPTSVAASPIVPRQRKYRGQPPDARMILMAAAGAWLPQCQFRFQRRPAAAYFP
jgi:hypothetical protein